MVVLRGGALTFDRPRAQRQMRTFASTRNRRWREGDLLGCSYPSRYTVIAFLARTLGIHTDVAVAWQPLSAGDWTTYAAEISGRNTNKERYFHDCSDL
ncbi:hypothetical protein [Nocardia iowensis]|uniref:Uncharacterized protein n=1 Tax=Nocardia iowensis TaxID=204891 RepID=A0ABX8RRM2_NOCIO|nr:hypothetical protein [Nocardia iowensis]QXN91916.1 hypothetical protein KV110_01615 [Nocardia iowensis]